MVAEISELACVTGRILCGKVIGQNYVINAAKCVGSVVIASLYQLLGSGSRV